jgi:hypothetical protein
MDDGAGSHLNGCIVGIVTGTRCGRMRVPNYRCDTGGDE